MNTVNAKIQWKLSLNNIPPVLEIKDRRAENAYTPLLVFDNQYNTPVFEGSISNVPLWSAVIFNKELKGNESISCISYLSNKAPNNLMKKGAKFKLYEGFKMVAQGEIID